MEYDYLVVGAGLYGAAFARLAADEGNHVLVIDRRLHAAGNAYTEEWGGIHVHMYGPHIFHTDNQEVWDFVRRFADFNDFRNRPLASFRGRLYSLPFSMYTFEQMWGVKTAEEARSLIDEQIKAGAGASESRKRIPGAESLEERAISMVGTEIYEKLIRGYTEKQWGRSCSELPASIIERLPLRFTYNSDYYDDRYQGVPADGYTEMVNKMLDGIELRLDTDYLDDRAGLDALADRVVYTGSLDALFGYSLGRLEYRSVRFEIEDLPVRDFQGCAVVNYTDKETPWTRITEHKWFSCGKGEECPDAGHTVISREYSVPFPVRGSGSAPAGDSYVSADGACVSGTAKARIGGRDKGHPGHGFEFPPEAEPAYPLNDDRNSGLYAKYRSLADAEPKLIVGGRLAEYRYYDMDDAIAAAMQRFRSLQTRKRPQQ